MTIINKSTGLPYRFVYEGYPLSYTHATNTFYNKLCLLKHEFIKLKEVSLAWSLYDNAVEIYPSIKTLVKEVEEDLNYELSEGQCSTALKYFIYDNFKIKE